VNAAGNSAQTHWSGTYVDANGDGAGEIDPSTGNEGNFFIWPNNETICGYLTWDEWPVAQSDFDLYLYIQAQNGYLPWSRLEQSGSQPPIEANCLGNGTGTDLVVAWVIGGYRVVSNPRLDLFSESPSLQYQTAAGSVTDPATSPAALAVGALCWQSNALEPYSSQGPTIDGRVKPDIAGHDSVSGATYGPFTSCPSAFAGTSAASPEVAGAAALVKQAHPTWKANQIQEFLEKSALDLGAPGKDNQYGAGQLRLGALSISDTTPPQAWALASSGKKGKRIKLLAMASDDSGVVTIIEQVKRNGRTIATLRSSSSKASEPKTITTLWKAPAKLKGRIAHCVQARDKAGNKSTMSCAKVTLK
jgi:subtilisin family serine protease